MTHTNVSANVPVVLCSVPDSLDPAATSTRKRKATASQKKQNGNILSAHAPSPGSLLYMQNMLDRGMTCFNPDQEIVDFYQTKVEVGKDGLLRVKPEYTPSVTTVYPDSSIYGAMEPNLLFHAELLSAHYSRLNFEEQWVLEWHLVYGYSLTDIAAEMRLSVRTISGYYHAALRKLREFVFYDDGQATWQLPRRKPLLELNLPLEELCEAV
ncbi:MAG TPA: sigma factor-like helix-turn-helix DNA-binding protein [Chloroflexia bacterium]|nr:sigma factor-like helix-turn-helix DNA-binding protein [Chloroflexia bacterium]